MLHFTVESAHPAAHIHALASARQRGEHKSELYSGSLCSRNPKLALSDPKERFTVGIDCSRNGSKSTFE
jgi:hypothetical protein